MSEKHKMVSYQTELLTTSYETELLDACEFGDVETVSDMIAKADPKKRYTEKGETALHWAARYGQLPVVEYLVEVALCDVNCTSYDGSTPLYLACRENRVAVIEYLIKNPDTYPSMRDIFGVTPLHFACKKGSLKIVKCLIEERLVNPNCKDNKGETPLHLACRGGHKEIVEYLVRNPKVDSNCSDSSGMTPLYRACSCGYKEIAEGLLKASNIDPNCSEANGWTPLHWAAEWGFLGIVKTLIEEHHIDPNCRDSKGLTPLHWACRSSYGRTALLTYLVQEAKADIDCVTIDGQTAFDFIRSSDGTRLLLTLGARPTNTLDEQFFPSILRQDPAGMSVKMFVLGKSGTGKSTLSKSLQSERKAFSRFVSRYVKTRNVDKQTAGIIPYEVIKKTLGSVTIFDFAGDKVFYAGHDAVLCSSIANSPSIVLVMVDLRDEKSEFQETLIYWLEFVKNRCTERGPRPHLFLIGSHADQVKDVQEKSQLMKSLVSSSKVDGFTYAGQLILDCRFAESSQMSELYTMLAQSCHTLRNSQVLDFDSHCFLLFLLDKFKVRPALTLGDAVEKVAEASQGEIYWTFLKSHNLLEICEKLNERGNILFMKNHSNPNNSWIILNKPVLLSHVLGTIFAPEGYKQHCRIANSMGIVPISNLINLFPKFDPNLLTHFLIHMGFCQEIDHQFLPCLHANDISYSKSERYFLFPGLVQLSSPSDLWQCESSDKKVHSGWALQCSGPGQLFSSRFVQILLLHLLSIASSDPPSAHSPQRKCHVWKNGITWSNNGIDTIVEVDGKTVTFLQRCKQSEKLAMVNFRSTIIRKIFEIKEETCPKVCVHEFIVSPEDSKQHPLDLSKVASVSIENLARAVIQGEKTVSVKDRNTLELEYLLQFEPYAQLNKEVLQELFTANNGKEVTERFLYQILDAVHCKETMIEAIISQPPSQQALERQCSSKESADNQDLLEEFRSWRLSGQRKVQDIRDKLDQHSIFAGRNVFESFTTFM